MHNLELGLVVVRAFVENGLKQIFGQFVVPQSRHSFRSIRIASLERLTEILKQGDYRKKINKTKKLSMRARPGWGVSYSMDFI